MIPVKSAFLFALLTSVVLFGAHCTAEAQANSISIDLNAAPLRTALTRLQDASGLHLAFAADLVRDAEPVTLSAKDEPVDAVLLRILRPRGLECIYTGETMAAIVRADSDIGMAKAAGRAMRTLARLERKLEGAVQEGDEVRVPGWSDEDDRALAEGIIDMVALDDLYWLQQPYQSHPIDLPRLLKTYDSSVRIGACAAAFNMRGQQPGRPAEREAVTESVLKALADPDPSARAGAVFILSCLRSFFNGWQPAVQKALVDSANAAEPEIRFAAALAPALDDGIDPGLAVTGGLRKDPHPAVRAAAVRTWLRRQRNDPQLSREFAAAMAAESNPVAKALAVLFACTTYAKPPGVPSSPYETEELLLRFSADLERVNDPWLRLATTLGLSLKEAASSKASPDKVNAAIQKLTALMTSGKPSHQALAVSRMRLHIAWLIGAQGAQPDFSKLAALADSPSLWPRLFGILVNGACTGEAAEARILHALKSSDALFRAAGLLACAAPPIDGSSKDGRPPALASLKNGAAFREALLAALRSPCLTESIFAARALSRRVAFDDRLALFREEARRNPRTVSIMCMLRSLIDETYSRGLQEQRGTMVLDAVLESKDPELETYLVKHISSWYPNQILRMILDSEPEAFFALLAHKDQGLSFMLRNTDPNVRAVLDRLTAIFEEGGPNAVEAVRKLAAFTPTSGKAYHQTQCRPVAFGLVDSMLGTCMAEGASDEKLAAACELAASFFGYWSPFVYPDFTWNDAPPGLRAAVPRLLEYVDHKTLGPKVAALLGALYQRFDPLATPTGDAALFGAMETGRAKIMASDRVADQVVLLTAMVGARSDATAAVAQDQLEMLLVSRTVPEGGAPGDLRVGAVIAIARHAERVPPEFGQFLMSKLAARTEAPEFEQAAVQALAHCPEEYSAIVDLLAKEDEQFLEFAMPLLNRGMCLQRNTLKEQGKAAPDWTKPADFGLAVINDHARSTPIRQQAVFLYAYAAAEPGPLLEKMALDEKQEVAVRSTAAHTVVFLNPKTNLLTVLLENYTKLPRSMREQMTSSSADATDTPGAEAFLLRGLKDPEIDPRSRMQALRGVRLPPTDTLISGLKELEHDPEIGADVQKAIKRLEEKK